MTPHFEIFKNNDMYLKLAEKHLDTKYLWRNLKNCRVIDIFNYIIVFDQT